MRQQVPVETETAGVLVGEEPRQLDGERETGSSASRFARHGRHREKQVDDRFDVFTIYAFHLQRGV